MTIVKYHDIQEITGDILKLRVPTKKGAGSIIQPRLDDIAIVHTEFNQSLLAQIIYIENDIVSLQLYGGTKGLSTKASVSFVGQPMQVNCSSNILGRVFNGMGTPIDLGPDLSDDDKTPIRTPTVNPMRRTLASKMIRTNIPMIDIFNCLVESQKIPIFSVAGEPYNDLLARIPAEGENRGNLAAGGKGVVVPLTPRDYWICEQLAPVLLQKQFWFVGIDVIGDYLTEINVTSPTCIREITAATGIDIAGEFIEFVLSRT